MLLITLLCILLSATSGLSDELSKLIDPDSGLINADELGNLTSLDLYSLRPERLSNLSGTELAALALAHPNNAALFEKPLLVCAKKLQRREFLKAIEGSTVLSEGVQQLLAATLIDWYPDLENHWKFELFKKTLDTGSPVLAYMPRAFLYSMETRHQQKFLYHLQQWMWPTPRSAEWAKKSATVTRIWAEMLVVSDSTPLNQLSPERMQFVNFILTGSSPDELEKIKLKSSISQDLILDLPLNAMQVRSVFASIIPSRTKQHSEKIKTSLGLLTPAQIVYLTHRNFSMAAKESFLKNKQHQVSWASAAQLAYLLLEETNEGKSEWDLQTVTNVGKWIYALPISYLRHASKVIADLPEDKKGRVLDAIDSAQLSGRQARVLIGSHLSKNSTAMEIILELRHNLLLAVPTAKINERPVLPQDVITHLLSNLPAESTARFSLFSKIRDITGKKWVLESMFGGMQSPERFANLMSLEEIELIAMEIGEMIKTNKHIGGWPLSFLRVVAYQIRANNMTDLDEWAKYLLSNPLMVSGLNCSDINELGAEYGVPMFSAYGQFLRETGQKYPKEFRKCALQAILSYLKTRARLEQIEDAEQLLDVLYPSEIMSIGGFPFSHLPYSFIKSSKNWVHIIRAISQLSVVELLDGFVLPGSTPLLLSQIAFRLENKKDVGKFMLDGMGNLFQFLPYSEQLHKNLDHRAFRLWLEGIERKSDTALCVTRASRASLWYRIIDTAYGPPSGWSAGTVASIGGLLIAVPSSKLAQIPLASLVNAADQLDKNMGYTPEFMRLCSLYLGPEEAKDLDNAVKYTMRVILRASNELAKTVQVKFEKKRRNDDSQGPYTPKLIKISNSANLFERPFKYLLPHTRVVTEAQMVPTAKPLTDLVLNQVTESTTAQPMRKVSAAKPDPNNTLLPSGATSYKNGLNFDHSNKDKISCAAFKMAPLATLLTLDSPDLHALDAANELVDCLPYFGTLDLTAPVVRNILEYIEIKKLKVDVRDIGSLASQVNMTSNLTDLDVVATLGYNIQQWEQINYISELVLEANSVNDTLPNMLAIHLGRLICGESIWVKNLMTPDIFLKVYPSLASSMTSSSRCPPSECLTRLIKFAEQPEVFGPIPSWKEDLFIHMGSIMAGLDSNQILKMENLDVLDGLQPGALRCLPSRALRVMTEAHFHKLSLASLETIFFYRFKEISYVQQSLVRRTLVSSHAHAILSKVNYSLTDTQFRNVYSASSATWQIQSFLLTFVASAFVIVTYM